MFRFVVFITFITFAAAGVVPQLDGRIVGGKKTNIESYPHQISLRRLGNHICGGSIYKQNAIITAAHCVYGAPAAYLTVVAGTSYRTHGGTTHQVTTIHTHPQYSMSTTNNDIAILILATELVFSKSIQPIALTEAAPADGTKVHATGWGTTKEGGSTSSVLRFVEISIVNSNDCNRAYAGKITGAMICAGTEKGGKDACQGDSGGPLVADGKLIGVVSWGIGCGRRSHPGVYSNVAVLASWIKSIVPDN